MHVFQTNSTCVYPMYKCIHTHCIYIYIYIPVCVRRCIRCICECVCVCLHEYVCVYVCIYTYIYTQRASAACSCSCIANPRAHSYVHTQCAAATQGKAFGFHMYMNRGEIKDIAGKIGCAFACICKQALALGNGLPECTAGTRRVVHIHRRLGP